MQKARGRTDGRAVRLDALVTAAACLASLADPMVVTAPGASSASSLPSIYTAAWDTTCSIRPWPDTSHSGRVPDAHESLGRARMSDIDYQYLSLFQTLGYLTGTSRRHSVRCSGRATPLTR